MTETPEARAARIITAEPVNSHIRHAQCIALWGTRVTGPLELPAANKLVTQWRAQLAQEFTEAIADAMPPTEGTTDAPGQEPQQDRA